jgi:hypothetical protein
MAAQQLSQVSSQLICGFPYIPYKKPVTLTLDRDICGPFYIKSSVANLAFTTNTDCNDFGTNPKNWSLKVIRTNNDFQFTLHKKRYHWQTNCYASNEQGQEVIRFKRISSCK